MNDFSNRFLACNDFLIASLGDSFGFVNYGSDADFYFSSLFLRCYFIKRLIVRLSLNRLPPHVDFYDLVGASMHVHVLRLLNLMSMAMRRVRQVRSWSDEGIA